MKKAVLISCFNWYEKRLEIIREQLISRGYEVVVLLSDFDHITKAPIDKRYGECTYLPTLPYRKNISLTRIRSHINFGKSVAKSLREHAPDLIYALVPPNSVAKQCLSYKQSHPEVTYIVDVIDLWPESMPLGFMKKSFLARKWTEMRAQSLKEADGIVLECDLYRQSLPTNLKTSHIATLRLYSDYEENELNLAKEFTFNHLFDKTSQSIRFAYIGSLNSITDYASIIDVVDSFLERGWQVSFDIIGDGEKRQFFIEQLEAKGCQISYHGMIFDTVTKIKLVGNCDFAFNMMTDQVSVGLTMKSIDYLSIGLPIINNIKGDTWKLVSDFGIGFNYSGEATTIVEQCQSINYVKMRSAVRSVLEQEFTFRAFERQVTYFLDLVISEEKISV